MTINLNNSMTENFRYFPLYFANFYLMAPMKAGESHFKYFIQVEH